MSALSGAQRRRALAVSVVEGMLHAAMVGVSESYLGALAVELGHRDIAIAVLVTVPLLVGALAQLAAGRLSRRLGRRRLVVIGAAIQALSHLAFYVIARTHEPGIWPLLAAKTVFWVSGMIILPPWSAWMAVLTEGVPRESYFARRSALTSLALLAAFVFAGYYLQAGRAASDGLGAFAVTFALGLVARGSSCVALMAMPRVESPVSTVEPSLRAVLRNSQLRVPIYLAVVTFGTYLAAPFFTPYMLRVLAMDFREFALMLGVATLTKVVSFPAYDWLARRYGLSRVLLVAGMGVALVPVAWAVTVDFRLLVAAQVLSGAAWSGVEFASFQLLLLSGDDEHRTGLMSISSALNGVLQVAAGLIGGVILAAWDSDFCVVFLVSSAARAVALVVLWSAVRRETFDELPRVFVRIVSVRPVEGVVRRLAGWQSSTAPSDEDQR